jgi:hypothetical protein
VVAATDLLSKYSRKYQLTSPVGHHRVRFPSWWKSPPEFIDERLSAAALPPTPYKPKSPLPKVKAVDCDDGFKVPRKKKAPQEKQPTIRRKGTHDWS